eukprot:COSAG01_NODE_15407_length_1341_cov_13.966989_1_plen_69_part_00
MTGCALPGAAGRTQLAEARQHISVPCCLLVLNPPIPEKKAAAGWLCARVFPRKGHSRLNTARGNRVAA